MSVTRCASSHLITELLEWRNPHGEEERWLKNENNGVVDHWEHAGKVISTEIGLGILIVTSAVETIVYSSLALISLGLYPVTNRPCKFFATLIQSSTFTTIWGLADALIYNPFFVNVITKESFARYWAEKFNPTSFPLYRFDDLVFIADWGQTNIAGTIETDAIDDNILSPIVIAGQSTQTMIDEGAKFIADNVLLDADNDTITLFKEMDSSITMFILTKAVYIYAAGEKKNHEIFNFFKPTTRNLILDLRQELNNEDLLIQLQYLTANPTQFKTVPQSEEAKSALNKLKNIAAGELQNSLLTSSCWQKAINLLNEAEIHIAD